jgi:hypothetical protein
MNNSDNIIEQSLSTPLITDVSSIKDANEEGKFIVFSSG